jgi:hypothetical protein
LCCVEAMMTTGGYGTPIRSLWQWGCTLFVYDAFLKAGDNHITSRCSMP